LRPSEGDVQESYNAYVDAAARPDGSRDADQHYNEKESRIQKHNRMGVAAVVVGGLGVSGLVFSIYELATIPASLEPAVKPLPEGGGVMQIRGGF
jgi:hypothetical protein